MTDDFKKKVIGRLNKLKGVVEIYNEGIYNLTRTQQIRLAQEIAIIEDLLELDKK